MINLWSENIKVTNLSFDIHKKWNKKGHVEGYFNHIIEKYCICKRLEKKEKNQESVGELIVGWIYMVNNYLKFTNEWMNDFQVVLCS